MKMATITFKAKIQTMYDMDDNPLYGYIVVPEFKKSHCNMQEFSLHSKYGAYANSDLFIGMLKRIRKDLLNDNAFLRLDCLPDSVSVEKGFLSTITITV